MKVWAVEHIYYDDSFVYALYTTEEKAKQIQQELNSKISLKAYYEVTEMEVLE